MVWLQTDTSDPKFAVYKA